MLSSRVNITLRVGLFLALGDNILLGHGLSRILRTALMSSINVVMRFCSATVSDPNIIV